MTAAMTKAIRIHETGGPEVMKFENVDVPSPGAGEVHIRHDAIGVNYIDVYHRTGLYPLPSLPSVIGLEGAGVPPGGYAEERLIPAHRLVKLPDAISTHDAAGMMLRGMTAQYLLRRTYDVKPGDTILVHAAAGGVGQLLCQWGKALGARTIGTVGSDEKGAIAKTHGCDHVINYATESFPDRVKEITDGAGVNVVYDGVGKSTFIGSLDCLAPLGMMASFGNASGPVPPFDPGELAKRGSLFFTRPSLMHYTAKREDLVATATDLFDAVLSGKVMLTIGQTYPLAEAAQAHSDMEARKTQGSTILLP